MLAQPGRHALCLADVESKALNRFPVAGAFPLPRRRPTPGPALARADGRLHLRLSRRRHRRAARREPLVGHLLLLLRESGGVRAAGQLRGRHAATRCGPSPSRPRTGRARCAPSASSRRPSWGRRAAEPAETVGGRCHTGAHDRPAAPLLRWCRSRSRWSVAVCCWRCSALISRQPVTGLPRPPRRTVQLSGATTSAVVPSGPDAGSGDGSGRARHQIGGLLIGLYVALVGTLIGIVAVVIARSLGDWRPARRARRRRAPPLRAPGPAPDSRLAAQLAGAASAGLDELAAEGPATDTIIACWQRMRSAAEAGRRRPGRVRHPGRGGGRASPRRCRRSSRPRCAARRPLPRGPVLAARPDRGDVWVARQELQTVLGCSTPPAGRVRALPHRASVAGR